MELSVGRVEFSAGDGGGVKSMSCMVGGETGESTMLWLSTAPVQVES